MKNFIILFTLLLLCACGGQSKEELVSEGQKLAGEGNHRGAVVLFKSALEKDVNYIDARLGLARAYLDSGNFDKSEKEFQKILLQDPNQSELLLDLAKIHIRLNLAEKAIEDIKQFHSMNNAETVDSLVLLGRAYGMSNDLSGAEDLFNKALVIDSQAIDPRLNLAKVALKQQKLDKSVSYLEQILSIDSTQVPPYYLLANISLRKKNVSAALDIYSRLLTVDPDQFAAMYQAGILSMDLGQLDRAQTYVDSMLSRFKDRAAGSRLQGMLLYRQGDYEGARVTLENSLKTEKHLLAYFFLGLNYYALGQYELALNQFQSSLDQNPNFERARILVAMTLLKQKRLDDAILETQKVLLANPDNAYARNILGSAFLANGQYDDGMAELEMATELDPTLVDAHVKRGLFHLSKGDTGLGEADLVKAVKVAPEVLNSRLMLVTHYLRQKNYSEAISLLKEGMSGAKSDALLNNYLAAAYFSQKKAELALAALDAAKKVDPDYLTPYFNRAAYFASRSEYEMAVAEYEQVLSRDKINLRALVGLAGVYGVMGEQESVEETYKRIENTGTEKGFVAVTRYLLSQKRIEEASASIRRGLEAHGSSAPLLELTGFLHLQAKEFPEAEAALTKLSGVVPEKGHSLLVRLYLMQKQVDKALSHAMTVLAEDRNKAYPYLLVSGLLIGQKNNDEALKILEEGVVAVSDPTRLKMQIGRINEIDGNLMMAESVYRRIVDSSPRFSPAYTSLGILQEKKGNKAEALDLYRQALKYDKRSVPALNNIAYLLSDNFGENEEALTYAMNAYRLMPNDPRVMDTLGYILVKNKRADEAFNLLENAYRALPENPIVALHLAQAKIKSGRKEGVSALLDFIEKAGSKADKAKVVNLRKKL